MKSILLPFQDDDIAQAALELAYLVAQRYASRIDGLFVLPQPQIIAGEGIALPGVYLTQMAEDGQNLAAAARERFARFMSEHGVEVGAAAGESGVSAGWREVEGLESQVVGDCGRTFDLSVVGRTTKYYAGDWNMVCEAALFESGRPVLIASPRCPQALGENILIAWNCSTETARTVALSMPFLHDAAQITVLTVDGATVPGPPGEELVRCLERHGIRAEARTVDPGGRSGGETVLAEAGAIEADLIVKGAYTHTRLKQMIFGGVTRHILTHAELPVLMSH